MRIREGSFALGLLSDTKKEDKCTREKVTTVRRKVEGKLEN